VIWEALKSTFVVDFLATTSPITKTHMQVITAAAAGATSSKASMKVQLAVTSPPSWSRIHLSGLSSVTKQHTAKTANSAGCEPKTAPPMEADTSSPRPITPAKATAAT
jgi:hypothetical protein